MKDLLILGGGPAGSAAAITAVQAGLDVTLLERASFPRHRPGETLHPGVEPLLRRLGVAHIVADRSIVRHQGVRVVREGQRAFQPYGADGEGSWYGFQLPRASFDAGLLEAAAKRGADIHFGCEPWRVIQTAGRVCGVKAGEREWRARWTVDAAGASHHLARQLGLEVRRCSPKLVARYGYMTGNCPEIDDVPEFSFETGGWRWCARIGPSLYQWTTVTDASGWRGASVAPLIASLQPAGPVRGADVSWRYVPQCAGSGYFQAGDAAAVLDPSAAHGVLSALMCGMKVGHLIAGVEAGRVPETIAVGHYREWLGRWFAHDCRLLRSLSAWPQHQHSA